MTSLRVYVAIATFLPMIGGAEKQAFMHCQQLRERGYTTTLVTFRHDRATLASEMMEGVPVLRIAGPLLMRRERFPAWLQKLCYLLALILMGWTLWRHRYNYDAVHVYQLNLIALPTAIACWFARKPMIISIHSAGRTGMKDVPATPAPHRWHVGRGRGNGRGISRSTRPRMVSLVAGPLDASTPWLHVEMGDKMKGDLEDLARLGRFGVRFTRTLLCRNRAVIVILSSRMRHYLALHDLSLPDVQLIPNGVDTVRFRPPDLGVMAGARAKQSQEGQTRAGARKAPDRHKAQPLHIEPASTGQESIQEKREQVVVCVSRLSYEKGIDVLLQAWRHVHEQCPQAKLLLVGDGPLHSRCEQMAQALNITTGVEFMGLQSDVPAQLHRGSIAVLPSRREGMPNAVLEAMACGLPCVAARVSGSEDIISHGVNGLLVEPEDYEGMAQALLTLLRDPHLTRRYGYAARRTIEERYSLEYVTDEYVELYSRITGHKLQARQDIPVSV